MTQSNSTFNERYKNLNDEQRKAVDTIDGPVLVLAGPGSGKTELLSVRVGNILLQTDTLPSSILCLTFTDAAAINMKRRLAGLIGQDAYRVAIHTFHSFGSEIINGHPEYFYHGASYKAADAIAQYSIIEEILKNSKHSSLLKSYHQQQGYTYLKDILKKISELKNGGLNPEDFRNLLNENHDFLAKANNLLPAVFNDRMSAKTLPLIPELLSSLRGIEFSKKSTALPYNSIKAVLTESLAEAYENAVGGEKPNTKPVTDWKNNFTKKNNLKEIVFSDLENITKQFELCEIYIKYQELLHKNGYFDFEDMLLDAVEALQIYPELKYNLQEKYLYILVDEFQDTNGVQMRMLDLITNAGVNEGKPNILAVGDDDQSIFKFQGANIDNIMDFSKRYDNPSIVVLQKNYRSTQQILDYIRKVILMGLNRLENRLPDQVKKELYASNGKIASGQIVENDFATSLHEMVWISKMINEISAAGKESYSEIAVIAPKHAMLENIAKVLDYDGIPVCYSRRKDLLDMSHIKDLINILRFIDTIIDKDQKEADHLLPEILCSPIWTLNRIDVWKVSTDAFSQKKLWLEVMQSGENEKLKNIADFLINLGIGAKIKNAGEIIDLVTGVSEELSGLDEDGSTAEAGSSDSIENSEFHSPYKKYYFDKSKFVNSRLEYLDLLQSLQAFIDKLRKYKGGGVRNVAEILEFINLHEKHNLSLYYESRFNIEEKAVNLLSAHGAKGLEFKHVFVTNCQEDGWIKNRMADKLSFPSNLPLAPESENIDDKLRLFYVALSRAKSNLYLSGHKYNDKGDEQIKLRFIETASPDKAKRENISSENIQSINAELSQFIGLDKVLKLRSVIDGHQLKNIDEEEILRSLLKDYKLSVTHLNNFLNVAESGPQVFLEQNLLRFPQGMAAQASYGTAAHRALNQFSEQLRKTKIVPGADFLIDRFKSELEDQRLNKIDHKNYLEKGIDDLRLYYEKRKDDFIPSDQSEFDFKWQGVLVGNAEITGKIDKMRYLPETREILVYDYKTGKVIKDFEHGCDYEKIKAWKYKNQLIFYKLLVENARDFKGKYVVNTGILEFLEPVNNEIKLLSLQITAEDEARMKKIIEAVYKKILNLDFPDVSQYEKSMEGIESFIDDLLSA